MARTIIKKINVLSLAKIYGLFLLIVSGFFAALYGLGMILFGIVGDGGNALIIGGLLVIFLAPILYGVFGFVMGALSALVYNLLAGVVGGLELELETKR